MSWRVDQGDDEGELGMESVFFFFQCFHCNFSWMWSRIRARTHSNSLAHFTRQSPTHVCSLTHSLHSNSSIHFPHSLFTRICLFKHTGHFVKHACTMTHLAGLPRFLSIQQGYAHPSYRLLLLYLQQKAGGDPRARTYLRSDILTEVCIFDHASTYHFSSTLAYQHTQYHFDNEARRTTISHFSPYLQRSLVRLCFALLLPFSAAPVPRLDLTALSPTPLFVAITLGLR